MDDAGLELADRIRALIGDEPTLEEKRMFGTRAFLRGGRILVGARKGGVMLVRLSAERGAEMLTRPGASIAVMGAKSMGPTWLDVAAEAIADDERLMLWIDAARESSAGR